MQFVVIQMLKNENLHLNWITLHIRVKHFHVLIGSLGPVRRPKLSNAEIVYQYISILFEY